MNRFEFAISGPSSSRKTETAHDIASALGENAVVISKGSFFRASSKLLNESSITPNSRSQEEIQDALKNLGYQIVNNNIVKAHINGNGVNHTHENGNHASEYSQNPIVQEQLNAFFQSLKFKLEEDRYRFIGTEGRSWAPVGGLNIFLTAPKEVRVQIKRLECFTEVCNLNNNEIIKEISKRDIADFRNPNSLFRIPHQGVIVRRFDTTDETHLKIVNDLSSAILEAADNPEKLPRSRVLWEYGRQNF